MNVLNTTSELWTAARYVVLIENLLVQPDNVQFIIELWLSNYWLRTQDLRL